MIEEQTIGGRKATIAYLDAQLQPVDDRDDAELIKLIWRDTGDTLWLTAGEEEPLKSSAGRAGGRT